MLGAFEIAGWLTVLSRAAWAPLVREVFVPAREDWERSRRCIPIKNAHSRGAASVCCFDRETSLRSGGTLESELRNSGETYPSVPEAPGIEAPSLLDVAVLMADTFSE